MTMANPCPDCGGEVKLESGLCPFCLLKTTVESEKSEAIAFQKVEPVAIEGPSTKSLFGEPSRTKSQSRSDQPGDCRLPPSIPGFEVLDELGHGGMGTVYKARNQKLGHVVALKVLSSSGSAENGNIARFIDEAKVVAGLQHPNIVRMYELGEHQGLPYLTLEYCERGTLAQWLRDHPSTPATPRQAASLIETLARAIEVAHQAHIVHRDLTPGNILFARGTKTSTARNGKTERDLLADAIPKISDFGLAKNLDVKEGYTLSGAVVGTPSYMSPEQATGKGMHIGPATDIYALGAILYKLLTGRSPFRGPTAVDTIFQVIHDDPVPPSRLSSKTPRDLETICLKCLQKDPGKRYGSALALADDLARWQNEEPIHARPVGAPERFWRWCSRNRLTATLIFLVVILLLAGSVVSTAFGLMAMHERDRAEANSRLMAEERNKAEKARLQSEASKKKAIWERDRAQEHLTSATMLRIGTLFEKDPESALGLLNNETAIPVSARDATWGFYRDYCQRKVKVLRLRAHSIAWSPDDRLLATCGKQLRIWEVATLKEIRRFDFPSHRLSTVVWSSDGETIGVSCSDGSIQRWKTDTGERLPSLQGHGSTVCSFAWSPDGKTIVSAAADRTIKQRSSETGSEISTTEGPRPVPHGIAWSPDRKSMAAIVVDETGEKVMRSVQIRETSSGKEIRTFGAHHTGIHQLIWSPDGKTICYASHGGTSELWDTETGQARLTLPGKVHNPVTRVAWSSDSQRIATSGWDQAIRLWSAETGSRLMTLKGHDRLILDMAWSHDGTRIASTGEDGTIKIWTIHLPHAIASFQGHEGGVQSLSWSPNGKRMASAAADSTLRVWDADSGAELAKLTGHSRAVIDVAWSPDGKLLASGSQDRTVKLWDVESLSEIASFEGHRDWLCSVVFSPDGKSLVSGSLDGTIRIWDVEQKRLRRTVDPKAMAVRWVSFSPKGNRIAFAGDDRKIKIQDLNSEKLRAIPTSHTDRIECLEWDPQGETIATGSADQTVKLCDVATGKEIATLRGHVDRVTSLCWSPNGKTIATGSRDQTIRLWDVPSGHTRAILRGHLNPINELAFRQDGKVLASAADLTIRLWHVDPDRSSSKTTFSKTAPDAKK